MYEAYLEQYPDGFYSRIAKVKINKANQKKENELALLEIDNKQPEEIKPSKSSLETSTFGISGDYVATMTGNRSKGLYKVLSRSSEVTLTLKGTKLTGSIDNNLGEIWGDIEGNKINFEWFIKGGTSGRGTWTFQPETGEMLGSWTHTSSGDGGWNMKRTAKE